MKITVMKNRSSFLLSFIVTACFAGLPVHAQDKTVEIDKIFGWAQPSTPGCAIAVSQSGKVVVSKAYGSADLERDVPITVSTVFDAASVSKQFVAVAVLILVEEGKLSLTEDIHKYVPELPAYSQKITLDHLMTHTSGIRDWTGIFPLTGGNEGALTLILRQRGLSFAPGDKFSYSNSGFVLLKEIVARVSGMSFDDFARKNLFEPLGMKNTSYRTDLRQVIRNRALAYDKGPNGWTMAIKLDNVRGGQGGLMSTPSDLLIWNDALTSGRLGKFVTEKLHEQIKLNSGRTVGYSRGLFHDIYRGTKEIWHSGGAGGYSTYLGRFPEHNLSIAVQCNTDAMSSTSFGHRIADLYVPAPTIQGARDAIPPIAAEGVDAAGLDLDSRVGLYFVKDTREPLQLAVDRGRLRLAGGPILVAQSKDRFKRWGNSLEFMSGDEFEVYFLTPDEFELRSMDGKTTRYRRAEAYTPTVDDLKAFAGRYSSDETGIVFRFETKGNTLQVLIEHSPSRVLEMKPVARDTFQLAGMLMHFIRDKAGNVVALDYRNPVVSDIKFVRLNDR
jgi:CubicO group peptidase (beta-lactamase class C family)